MGLESQFNQSDIKEYIQNRVSAYRDAILSRLKQAGEKFVSIARTSGTYIDRTGNLRSSVGYIILYDGVPLVENFKKVKEGDKGVVKGKELALKNAPLKGYALIGVAGMEYAAAVEGKGKDVITGSSLIVESWLKNALSALKSKI